MTEDQDCTTGWGNVQENGLPSDKLRDVKVKRVPLARCNSVLCYGGTKDKTMTCAGYASGDKGACQNDSGGSMVWKSTVSLLRKFNIFFTFTDFFSHLLKYPWGGTVLLIAVSSVKCLRK